MTSSGDLKSRLVWILNGRLEVGVVSELYAHDVIKYHAPKM